MPNSGKNKKIVPYKKYSFFNIGTVLFGILFIYMIICVVLYMTSDHITSYEVTEGSLAGNDVYTALALRTEELITAPESGSVTYYAREGSKVGSGGERLLHRSGRPEPGAGPGVFGGGFPGQRRSLSASGTDGCFCKFLSVGKFSVRLYLPVGIWKV